MQSKLLKLLLSLILISTFGTTRAQQYFDHYAVPDTTNKTAIQNCVSVLDYFTVDKGDSLYLKLGSDSTVVNKDTLFKYSRLHKNKYSYTVGGTNRSTWELAAGEYLLTRTYVGVGNPSLENVTYENALQLMIVMKMVEGKLTISKITFSIVPVTEDAKKYITKPREARLKHKEKLMEEDMMNKAPKPGFPR